MKTMKILYYISLLCLFSGFTSFQITEFKTDHLLFQKWVYVDYKNGKVIYQSNRTFKKDEPGIEFKSNGTISQKQNSGWCGTPPINYEIVSGTWKNISKSILEIEYPYWGGVKKDTLRIIKLTKSKLILKPIYK